VISTLLIDLDNTLLDNDMERFIPIYLQWLGAHLAHLAPPEEVAAKVMDGSLAMVQNNDPTRTLEQIFSERFYPAIGHSEEELRPFIDDFYNTVFPDLKSSARPIAGAQQLVQTALNAGLEIVIATSPLFPRIAIEHRLAWADLPPEKFDFSLITSYEDFHFAKPYMAYYAEALGRLGKPAHEAAMIGNDPTDDLEPAQALGLAVFHVSPKPLDMYPGGSLEDAIAWLEAISDQARPQTPSAPEVLLARLRGQLAALIGLASDLDHPTWSRRPVAGEWAPNEIACHLRDVENEVNYPRVQAILTSCDPHLSAFDTDRWAEERDYLSQSGPEALDQFIQARVKTITDLEPLSPEVWSRPARHSLFGPTTLAEVLTFAVDHDLLHLAQLRATLAANPS
jgi:FMN phosphatase YigB (HAD superfamily)